MNPAFIGTATARGRHESVWFHDDVRYQAAADIAGGPEHLGAAVEVVSTAV